MIYAVGFGVEIHPPSYWRNDELSQVSLLNQKTNYWISGAGDGGLTDLFRLKVRDFRHERIFLELFGNADDSLLGDLRGLKAEVIKSNVDLFEGFNNLQGKSFSGGRYRKIIRKLKSRLRNDTVVTLNGRAAYFSECLDLARVSFSNAFLAYLLYKMSAFSYIDGNIDLADSKGPRLLEENGRLKTCENQLLDTCKLVMRHGPDSRAIFTALDLGAYVDEMKKRGKDGINSAEPLYPYGWWSEHTQRKGSGAGGIGIPAPVEFAPPAMVVHASTFVSTLADILLHIHGTKQGSKGSTFRITLHRITRADSGHYFQQLTDYAGNTEKKGGVGRVFEAKGGIVGLACRVAKLVIATKKSPDQFEKVWKLTNFEDIPASAIQPYVDALVACPFFAPPRATAGQDHVSMVLFADSADPNFFSEDILQVISAACKGFVNNLEKLCAAKTLIPIRGDYMGYPVESQESVRAREEQLQALGVTFGHPSLKGIKKDLTFKTIRNLDLEVGASEPYIPR